MKNRYAYAVALALAIVVIGAGSLGALAQTGTMAVMPTLYNQSGTAVNSGNTALAAGWYYTQANGSSASQVYYYGNGTYYDPNTRMYGGSVGNPNGTAGVSLGYSGSVLAVSGTPAVPGVPNTGAGGMTSLNLAILLGSGLAVIVGAAYVIRARQSVWQ